MSCYFVAQISIHDPGEYERYLEGFDEVFEKYDGEVVAVDDHPSVLEGHWDRTRIVLIRFPSEEEARRWYDSPEYQEIVQHRWRASKADVILVTGRS